VRQIDLMRYGHAMSIPVPGVRSSASLNALAGIKGRVMFAHSDLSCLFGVRGSVLSTARARHATWWMKTGKPQRGKLMAETAEPGRQAQEASPAMVSLAPRASPGQRFKLAVLAVLGIAVYYIVLVAPFAVLLLANPWSGYYGPWPIVAILLFFWWTQQPHRETPGEPVSRTQAPALFADLDVLADRLGAPRVDEVRLTDDFNAGGAGSPLALATLAQAPPADPRCAAAGTDGCRHRAQRDCARAGSLFASPRAPRAMDLSRARRLGFLRRRADVVVLAARTGGSLFSRTGLRHAFRA
jgi:hypothetical protein